MISSTWSSGEKSQGGREKELKLHDLG